MSHLQFEVEVLVKMKQSGVELLNCRNSLAQPWHQECTAVVLHCCYYTVTVTVTVTCLVPAGQHEPLYVLSVPHAGQLLRDLLACRPATHH